MDMGITPGTKITVLQAQSVGPILLEVRDSKLALGRGMASCVIVSRIG
jgi:ferrous iron transport protein A